MYVSLNNEALSCSHSLRGKTISITYSERVSVALGVQHANSLRHIVLQSVVCLALLRFPHYLINGTIFGKECEA